MRPLWILSDKFARMLRNQYKVGDKEDSNRFLRQIGRAETQAAGMLRKALSPAGKSKSDRLNLEPARSHEGALT